MQPWLDGPQLELDRQIGLQVDCFISITLTILKYKRNSPLKPVLKRSGIGGILANGALPTDSRFLTSGTRS